MAKADEHFGWTGSWKRDLSQGVDPQPREVCQAAPGKTARWLTSLLEQEGLEPGGV